MMRFLTEGKIKNEDKKKVKEFWASNWEGRRGAVAS